MKGLSDRFKIPADSGFLTKIEPESFMSVPLSEDAKLLEALRNADKYVGMTLFPREIPNKMNRMGGFRPRAFRRSRNSLDLFHHRRRRRVPSDERQRGQGERRETIARVSRLIFATAFELADR